jgi:hypothetical protein
MLSVEKGFLKLTLQMWGTVRIDFNRRVDGKTRLSGSHGSTTAKLGAWRWVRKSI